MNKRDFVRAVGGAPLALLALGVFACERKADTSVFDLAGLDETSVEGVAVRELDHLAQRGLTVAEWRSRFPGDSVRVNTYLPRLTTHDMGERCGYATRTTTTAGLVMIRDAVFSFRDVPVPVPLPDSREAADRLTVDACVLSAVALTVTPADSSGGAALATRLGEAIGRRLKGATPAAPVDWLHRKANNVTFRAGDIEVTSYYHWGLHLVLARAEVVRAAEPKSEEALSAEDRRILARAVTLSGLDSGVAAPLLAADRRIAAGPSVGPRPSDTALVAALEGWIAAARPLPPERRAAALLAADRLLTLAGAQADTGLARRLRALGARVAVHQVEEDFDEAVGGWYVGYAGNWIKEALGLVDSGEVVDLTLAPALLGSVQDRCAIYADSAARAGEGLLIRAGTPATRFTLHQLTAQAYAMIQEHPEARRRALDHYRAALAIDSTSARAGALWREAWDFAALEMQPHGWMVTEMC